MWNKATIIKLLTCAAMFAAATVNATTEQALVCQGCNYQQAKSLAMSNAQPLPQCQDGSGTGFPTLETQICFSQPEKFIVFDAVSRQAYPFEVYHANQGGSMRDLRASVTTRDRTVHPTAIELLNTGVDMHTELMDSFDEIAQRLMTLKQTEVAEALANTSYVMAQSSCANDADAAAIQDAFDTNAIDTLQRNAQAQQREQTDGILESFKSFFDRNTAVLDSANFALSRQGVIVEGKVLISSKTASFSAIYNSANNISLVNGRGVNANGTPTLVYDIKMNTVGDLVVQLNRNYSYLSSNDSLARLTNGAGDTVSLSACAAEALDSVLPNVQFSYADGGGIFGDSPPPVGTGGGGTVADICNRTVLGKVNGKVVLTMTVNICN